jgi:Zn-dependent protease with chaperone function
MKKADQQGLIRALEARAERDPEHVRRRVIGLGVLGYAFFAALVATLLAAGFLAVYLVTHSGARYAGVKILIPIGIAIWACAKALFVSFPKPEGIRLSRPQAPRLFALIDRLQDRLRTPKVHEVLMTMDVNASVSQRPRLGWFGWYRNTLSIGWPLIEGLSVKEFEAVMAHELGHLSSAHGRLSSWGYRVRTTFARLIEQFEAQQSILNKPVAAFLEWWWPKLDAYTFVLSRRQELEADRAAADFAGAPNVITALLRTSAIGDSLSQFWPTVFAHAAQGSPVPGDTLGRLSAFVQGLDAAQARNQLRTTASESTGVEDTHPALKDRAKALGVALSRDPQLPEIAVSAGSHYLGEQRGAIRAEIQKDWESTARVHWEAVGEFLKGQQKRLAELQARPEESLSAAEAWERCELLQNLGRDQDALAAAAALLDRYPDWAPALLLVGRERLKQDAQAGVELLTKAARVSGEQRAAALSELIAFHRRENREQEALELERQLFSHEDLLAEAARERNNYAETDELLPHGLAADDVARLVQELRQAAPQVSEIRLARKKLRHFADEQPLYVVGFRVGTPWYRESGGTSQDVLKRLVQAPLPYSVYFVGLDAAKTAAKRLAALPDSLVFSG